MAYYIRLCLLNATDVKMPNPAADPEPLEPYLANLRELPFVRQATVIPVKMAESKARLDLRVEVDLIDGTRETWRMEVKTSHLGRGQARHL